MADQMRDESSRESVERDAAIYLGTHDPDLDSDTFARWAMCNAATVWRDLD